MKGWGGEGVGFQGRGREGESWAEQASRSIDLQYHRGVSLFTPTSLHPNFCTAFVLPGMEALAQATWLPAEKSVGSGYQVLVRPRLEQGTVARGKSVMVRFHELSCLAKYAHFILQEAALWSSYLICEIGENGLGKACACTCVCARTHTRTSVYLYLSVRMYVYQYSHCMFTKGSGTLRGDGIFSLSHTDSHASKSELLPLPYLKFSILYFSHGLV